MNNTASAIVRCEHLAKTYQDAEQDVHVFSDINLTVEPGEFIGILGVSGSGKSSLLHLLGGLDKPSSGEVWLAGQAFTSLSEKKKSQLRNQYLGFVYQFHHLLPEFSAIENVAMPLMIRGESKKQAKQAAATIIDQVGLSDRTTHRVAQLSGGERQRIAIARALVTKPQCVLADEPTGNLDAETASHTFELMMQLNKELNTSLIIVTHNKDLVANADRILLLHEGILTPQTQEAGSE